MTGGPLPTWTPPTGAATRLLLVRHGATAHSAEHRFSGRNDLPLDELGTGQAAALARRFAADPVDAVVSSPLRRARQTAAAIADALGLDVEVVDDFAELDFGDWEGRTSAEIRADQPTAFAAWLASPDLAAPGGEAFSALDRRVLRGRDAVVAAHPGRRVAVVTHVTPIKSLVRFALDAPPSSFFGMFLDTASVSALECFDDGRTSLRLFNDTGHLRG